MRERAGEVVAREGRLAHVVEAARGAVLDERVARAARARRLGQRVALVAHGGGDVAVPGQLEHLASRRARRRIGGRRPGPASSEGRLGDRRRGARAGRCAGPGRRPRAASPGAGPCTRAGGRCRKPCADLGEAPRRASARKKEAPRCLPSTRAARAQRSRSPFFLSRSSWRSRSAFLRGSSFCWPSRPSRWPCGWPCAPGWPGWPWAPGWPG